MTKEKLPRGSQGCGTDAAYRRHIVAKERPCQACSEAHAALQQEPHYKQMRKDYDAVRVRTRTRFRWMHPHEWTEIFEEERLGVHHTDYNAARGRTSVRLRRMFPEDWKMIFEEERKKLIFDRQWAEAVNEYLDTAEP